MHENNCLKLPQMSNWHWYLKNELPLNIGYNFDQEMSLSKIKCWNSNNWLNFLKRPVPLTLYCNPSYNLLLSKLVTTILSERTDGVAYQSYPSPHRNCFDLFFWIFFRRKKIFVDDPSINVGFTLSQKNMRRGKWIKKHRNRSSGRWLRGWTKTDG